MRVSKPSKSSQIGLGEPLSAVPFQRHRFQRCARRVLALGRKNTGKKVRYLDGDGHHYLVLPFKLSAATVLCFAGEVTPSRDGFLSHEGVT